MRSEPVGPTRGTSSVGPIDGRIARVEPGAVAPVRPAGRSAQTPADDLDAFDRMEIHVNGVARRAYAQFHTHPRSGIVSIKIIDAETNEVIREIPSEDVVNMAEELQAYWDAHHRAGKG